MASNPHQRRSLNRQPTGQRYPSTSDYEPLDLSSRNPQIEGELQRLEEMERHDKEMIIDLTTSTSPEPQLSKVIIHITERDLPEVIEISSSPEQMASQKKSASQEQQDRAEQCASQEQQASSGQSASQEQQVRAEQCASQEQQASFGQSDSQEHQDIAEQCASQEQQASSGQSASQEQQDRAEQCASQEQQASSGQSASQEQQDRAEQCASQEQQASLGQSASHEQQASSGQSASQEQQANLGQSSSQEQQASSEQKEETSTSDSEDLEEAKRVLGKIRSVKRKCRRYLRRSRRRRRRRSKRYHNYEKPILQGAEDALNNLPGTSRDMGNTGDDEDYESNGDYSDYDDEEEYSSDDESAQETSVDETDAIIPMPEEAVGLQVEETVVTYERFASEQHNVELELTPSPDLHELPIPESPDRTELTPSPDRHSPDLHGLSTPEPLLETIMASSQNENRQNLVVASKPTDSEERNLLTTTPDPIQGTSEPIRIPKRSQHSRMRLLPADYMNQMLERDASSPNQEERLTLEPSSHIDLLANQALSLEPLSLELSLEPPSPELTEGSPESIRPPKRRKLSKMRLLPTTSTDKIAKNAKLDPDISIETYSSDIEDIVLEDPELQKTHKPQIDTSSPELTEGTPEPVSPAKIKKTTKKLRMFPSFYTKNRGVVSGEKYRCGSGVSGTSLSSSDIESDENEHAEPQRPTSKIRRAIEQSPSPELDVTRPNMKLRLSLGRPARMQLLPTTRLSPRRRDLYSPSASSTSGRAQTYGMQAFEGPSTSRGLPSTQSSAPAVLPRSVPRTRVLVTPERSTPSGKSRKSNQRKRKRAARRRNKRSKSFSLSSSSPSGGDSGDMGDRSASDETGSNDAPSRISVQLYKGKKNECNQRESKSKEEGQCQDEK